MTSGDHAAMWTLLACLGGEHPPAPSPGTPEASEAARPAWARSHGYAPSAPADLLQHREELVGALDSRMLSCELETTYRGDRQRLLASLRHHDTTRPDINVQLQVRDVALRAEGPEDSSTMRFGAPAVTASPGDLLSVDVSDRGVVRQVRFDVLTAAYSGQLPQRLDTPSTEMSCWVVPRERVEAALLEATVPAERVLALLDARQVDLYQPDFGRAVAEDPRQPVEAMAALVGWERAEVASRVQRVDEAEARFTDRIEVALRAEVPRMADRYSGQGLQVRSRGMQCPTFGYWRHGVQERCVIELEVERAPEGEAFRPQLLDLSANGSTASGHVLPLELAEDRWAEGEWRSVGEGESVLVILEVRDDRTRVLRFEGPEGITWMRL